MITCEVHESDIERKELVVTIKDDGALVVDHLNLGMPLNQANKPDLAEVRRMVSRQVERFRQQQREATE